MATETQKVDVLAVMLDDASAAYSYRRHIDADRGEFAKAESKAARESVANLIANAGNLATAMSNLIAARVVDAKYGQYVTSVTDVLARIGGAA